MQRLILTFMVMILSYGCLYSQPNLPPILRSIVCRLRNPFGGECTGIILRVNNSKFLVTNKHGLMDSLRPDNICDSIFVFKNIVTERDEVISDLAKWTVYTRVDSREYYYLPTPENVDLMIVDIEPENIDLKEGDEMYSLPIKYVKDWEGLASVLDNESIVTVIGYPGKGRGFRLQKTIPEYRWGRIISFNQNQLVLNVPILKGSSGSLALINKKTEYYLIGIIRAIEREHNYSLAVPISKVRSNFTAFFDKFKNNKLDDSTSNNK